MHRSSLLRCFLIGVTCGLASGRAKAEHPWIEIRSPHFRVLTNGSSAEGRKVANEFEQMRHVFVLLFKTEDVDPSAPLTIFAARSGDTFKELEPLAWKATHGNVAGNFLEGWERQYAVVRLDTWVDENQVVVYHEYTHSILHARAHWMPIWMDEGMAEFYGYTRFQDDRILVGAPSKRLGELRRNSLLPVSKMLETTSYSPLFKDEEQLQLFYAESWAMVHYMIFGKGMDGGDKLGIYLKRLEDGSPQAKVFQEVFGDMKAFDKGLSNYLDTTSFKAGVLPPDGGMDPKSFQERSLTPAETVYSFGCVQVGSHDYANAKASLLKAIGLDPGLAEAHEELGYLDFDAENDVDAVTEWKRALEIDPNRARALFATTMIHFQAANESTGELVSTQTVLRRVTELAPKFAPAYAELALIEGRMGQMQIAFKDSIEAERLEPRRAGYRLLTGRILLPAKAAEHARYVASHWFGADHNEAVELFEAIPAAQRGDGPVPTLDLPLGSDVVRGTLVEVSCSSMPGATLVVTIKADDSTDAWPAVYRGAGRSEGGFSDTVWWGEDHYSVCHHLQGHRALIAHKGEELVDLEARDDLPDAVTPGAEVKAVETTSPHSLLHSRG
jgi:tetratricopeptide (TPR) repeat protein